MKNLVLAVMVVCLAGCGSGGGSSSTDTGASQSGQSVAQKSSPVDGGWNSYSGVTVTGFIDFANGKVDRMYWIGNTNYQYMGVFSVSGNQLIVTYTTSTWSQSGLPLSQIGTASSTVLDINETNSYTYAITGNTLTLTDNATGYVRTFIKS